MLNLEEAILLRERGWKGPILMLEGFFHADELPLFDKYRLTTSLHSNGKLTHCRMRVCKRRWIST